MTTFTASIHSWHDEVFEHQLTPGYIAVWLTKLFKDQQQPPRLTAIYIAVSAGEPMRPLDSVLAIAGKGLQGDRYAEQRGFWKSVDACEVTLITQAEIDKTSKRALLEVQQQLGTGGHRRNLVISGLAVRQLSGTTFTIGEAVFRFQKPRPPCGYLDRVSEKGMCKALGKHSGACIEIVTGGQLTVGDTVRIIS